MTGKAIYHTNQGLTEKDAVAALDFAIGDHVMVLIKTGLPPDRAIQITASLLIQTGVGLIRENTHVTDLEIRTGVEKMLAMPVSSPEEAIKQAREIIRRRSPH